MWSTRHKVGRHASHQAPDECEGQHCQPARRHFCIVISLSLQKYQEMREITRRTEKERSEEELLSAGLHVVSLVGDHPLVVAGLAVEGARLHRPKRIRDN